MGALDVNVIQAVSQPSALASAWKDDMKAISAGSQVGLADHINNIYQALVGRQPTAAEFNDLALLATSVNNPATQNNMTATAEAAVLNHLLQSPTIQNSSLNNVQFVDALYAGVLGRSADQGGEQYWVSQLKNGASKASVAQNFLSAQELSSGTGYNHDTATFASLVSTLWQDDPQSWTSTKAPAVGGLLSPQATAISQLKTLMAANPNFTLVLDFDPQYSDAVTSGGAWNTTNLVSFLKGLNDAGLTPHVIYHPDAVTPKPVPPSTAPVPTGWFPDNGLTGDAINAMAGWMATLNKAILDAGLPQCDLLSGIVGEGDLLPKDANTYTTFKQDYQVAAAKLGLPSQNTSLWYTADWGADNTFSTNPSPITGTFVQLYDYWSGNPLADNYKPDPANASAIGAQLLTTLINAPTGQHSLNPELLQNPNGTVFTLNFSGSPTGNSTDAPIFGKGTGVAAPWNLTSTNQLLSALSSEAHTLYQANNNPTAIPQIAIWSAENALNDFVPVVGKSGSPIALAHELG